ncbi:hypothetical protein M9H77_23587 [Catharanthus roseus]|uniref:Uncharacterized protein n=1 Tax=Catharanthus roseus TaxID=4058 RepID=A0ACC0AUP5_CATRO|nr:hypothetical protein M9H77_23587 [Catharanthus roseus]
MGGGRYGIRSALIGRAWGEGVQFQSKRPARRQTERIGVVFDLVHSKDTGLYMQLKKVHRLNKENKERTSAATGYRSRRDLAQDDIRSENIVGIHFYWDFLNYSRIPLPLTHCFSSSWTWPHILKAQRFLIKAVKTTYNKGMRSGSPRNVFYGMVWITYDSPAFIIPHLLHFLRKKSS